MRRGIAPRDEMARASKQQLRERIGRIQHLIGDLIELDAVFSSRHMATFRGRPRIPFDVSFETTVRGRLATVESDVQIESTASLGGPVDRVMISVRLEPTSSRLPWLNVALFLLTVVSMTFVIGGEFAAWFLAILLFHEFGHFITARRRHIDVSWPYFIPFPNILGTLGAFIQLRSPIRDRQALFDMAVAGPLAGFVVAVIALFAGLSLSTVAEPTDAAGLILGESLLFKWIAALVIPSATPDQHVILHPIAYAGWAGLLVTMFNLLPIGQLDGGHIAYAMFGQKQRYIALAVIAGLGLASFYWIGWLLWVVIAIMMRPKHPPTLIDEIPLSKGRRILGWVSLAIFIVSFTPVPFSLTI